MTKSVEIDIIIEFQYDNRKVKDIQKTNTSITKPFLKWVGGKTQIIEKIIDEFPIEFDNYHEIFLGGGSVLLATLCYIKDKRIKIHGNIYAYDLNEPLIYTYKNIQESPDALYNTILELVNTYNSCGTGQLDRKPINLEIAKLNTENYYYWIRTQYNKLSKEEKKTILGSAMFIFLNKTCFRGVFRMGPNGFNVPYGHYNKPEIVNRNHLYEIHELIKNVIFIHSDFKDSLNLVKENDFVYLDPPYAPETENSFVGYTDSGFTLENHNSLFNILHNTNSKFLLSNSDVAFVNNQFNNKDKYTIDSILCKRSINSKKPESKTKEVLVKNY